MRQAAGNASREPGKAVLVDSRAASVPPECPATSEVDSKAGSAGSKGRKVSKERKVISAVNRVDSAGSADSRPVVVRHARKRS